MCPLPPEQKFCMNNTSTSTGFGQPTASRMSAEAIISIVFGILMFVLAMLALWQGYRHHHQASGAPIFSLKTHVIFLIMTPPVVDGYGARCRRNSALEKGLPASRVSDSQCLNETNQDQCYIRTNRWCA